MKMSGRLSMLILIALFIQGRAPLVTDVQAQGNERHGGNADQKAVTLKGDYAGWIEIDIRHSWDKPAPASYLMENYFSFNYVRSRGSIQLKFVSGRPQQVNIDLPLTFYLIGRQHIVPPPEAPDNLCRGYYAFTSGSGNAGYAGTANGNSMTFDISGFKFVAQPEEPSVTGAGGDCAPGIAPARKAVREAAETESALPGAFPWRFETTRWTDTQSSIGGFCASAEYDQIYGAATQCFWGAYKSGGPAPLVEPPYKR